MAQKNMRMRAKFRLLRCVLGLFFVTSNLATASGGRHYLVTNDDIPAFFTTSVSFYNIGAGGILSLKQQVFTGGSGIDDRRNLYQLVASNGQRPGFKR